MYTSFYGLSEPPFNLTSDPKYVYLSPSHREALASLLYGVIERKGLILLLGEVGTGKTTLLRTFLERLNGEAHTAFVFNTQVDLNGLLTLILDDLEIEVKEQSLVEKVRRLQAFAQEMGRLGKNVVVVVDEAQHLHPTVLEGLRLLSNIETPREKLVQVILSGQLELWSTLHTQRMRSLRQRIAVSAHLDPLRCDEVEAYILHRLRTAGYDGPGLFSPNAIRQIHAYTKGILRLVNIVCDHALLTGYVLERAEIGTDVVKEVIRDLEGLGGGVAEPHSEKSSMVGESDGEGHVLRKSNHQIHTSSTEQKPPARPKMASKRPLSEAQAGTSLSDSNSRSVESGSFPGPNPPASFPNREERQNLICVKSSTGNTSPRFESSEGRGEGSNQVSAVSNVSGKTHEGNKTKKRGEGRAKHRGQPMEHSSAQVNGRDVPDAEHVAGSPGTSEMEGYADSKGRPPALGTGALPAGMPVCRATYAEDLHFEENRKTSDEGRADSQRLRSRRMTFWLADEEVNRDGGNGGSDVSQRMSLKIMRTRSVRSEHEDMLRPSGTHKADAGADRKNVGYSLHLASFRSLEGAQRFVDELRDRGYKARISSLRTLGIDPWYRVLLGDFPEKQSALVAGRQLRRYLSYAQPVPVEDGEQYESAI